MLLSSKQQNNTLLSVTFEGDLIRSYFQPSFVDGGASLEASLCDCLSAWHFISAATFFYCQLPLCLPDLIHHIGYMCVCVGSRRCQPRVSFFRGPTVMSKPVSIDTRCEHHSLHQPTFTHTHTHATGKTSSGHVRFS